MTNAVRVAVVDRYPIFREGVVHAISRHKNLAVVGQGATADDAARIVREQRPDVLLMEIAAPDWPVLVRALLKELPNLKLIFLASAEDLDHVIQALHAGAHGYIMKGITGQELVDALHAVHRGERYITPDLAWRLVTQSASPPATVRQVTAKPQLTVREQQILDGTLEGLTNLEMARILGLGLSTIKYYKTILYKKISVRNRVEALVKAGASR